MKNSSCDHDNNIHMLINNDKVIYKCMQEKSVMVTRIKCLSGKSNSGWMLLPEFRTIVDTVGRILYNSRYC
jgi:hypothetical protein